MLGVAQLGGLMSKNKTLTIYNSDKWRQLLVKLEFRWAFAICFHKFGFSLSQFLHHLFIVLFHLPCKLEFRPALLNGEGVYPTALGYEMLTLSVQNVNL